MARMSLHKYAKSTCSGRVVTKADLLSYQASQGAVGEVALGVARAATVSPATPVIIGEGNSASCGGQAGCAHAPLPLASAP